MDISSNPLPSWILVSHFTWVMAGILAPQTKTFIFGTQPALSILMASHITAFKPVTALHQDHCTFNFFSWTCFPQP
jgi:hypothetical protein